VALLKSAYSDSNGVTDTEGTVTSRLRKCSTPDTTR
jgi:hypothetical protein